MALTEPHEIKLGDIKPFSLLPPKTLEALNASAIPLTIKQNQYLFTKGDKADSLYLVIKGSIAIELISEEGKTIRISTIGKNTLLGEFAALDNGTRTANARATQETMLICLCSAQFRKIIKNNAEFSYLLMCDLISKVRSTDLLLEDVSFRSLKERIGCFLSEHAQHNPGENERTISMTQSEIAECVGATREKVNIHLKEFEKRNIISLSRGKITILDKAQIETYK